MTRFQPLWLQAGSYAGSVDRRLLGALWPDGRSSGAAVTPTGSGMSVQAAPGDVAVPAANGTGSVLCPWDAPEVVNLNPSPPSGTNRIDLIICQSHGQDLDGGTVDDFVITFVAGAEAASPVAPAVPAGAVALAQVRINGGAASIVAGDITDTRPGSLSVPPLADVLAGHLIGYQPGPPAQMDMTTYAVLYQLNVPVKAGRRYLILAYAQFQQISANSNTSGNWVTLRNDGLPMRHDFINGGFVTNSIYAGTAWHIHTPPADGSMAVPLAVSIGPGAGRFLANSCQLAVIDLGKP